MQIPVIELGVCFVSEDCGKTWAVNVGDFVSAVRNDFTGGGDGLSIAQTCALVRQLLHVESALSESVEAGELQG